MFSLIVNTFLLVPLKLPHENYHPFKV